MKGILYEGWHGFASDAQRQIASNGSTPLVVEDVVSFASSTRFLVYY